MKITVFFLTVLLVQVSATSRAQISLHVTDASLENVLKVISKQSGYDIIYADQDLRIAGRVSVRLNDVSLQQALEQCFAGQPLDFAIEDKTVMIRRKDWAPEEPKRTAVSSRTRHRLQQSVTGRVLNTAGMPLEGVTVRIKGASTTTQTDHRGRFSIPIVEDDIILVFRMLGFEQKEVKGRSDAALQVTMTESVSNLDEVVVIGYGEIQRRDLTGAVGSVKVQDMQKAPVRSFEEALAGRVAGVQVSSQDGQPGSGIDIVIRGANSISQSNAPLYVIDGFPLESPDNNIINPAEIESIEVLKDASATAIYGARGANGVIMITTKGGKDGRPVIAYEGYYGTQEVLQRMDLMKPYEFIKAMEERNAATTRSLYFLDADGNQVKTLEDYRYVEGLDWQDHIFRIAPIQDHNLSIRGGNRTTKYSVSGSVFDQDGVLINSGYNRYQGRLRLDQTVNSRLKLNMNINYSSMTGYGNNPGGSYNSTLLYSAWGYRPVSGLSDIDLADVEFDEEIDLVNSPRFNPILSAENELRERINNALTANGYGEYTLGDFKLKVSAGISREVRKNNTFNNSQTRSGSPRFPGAATNGVNGSVSYSEINSYVNENTLAWAKKIRGHSLSALGGFTLQGRRVSGFGASAFQVPNEGLGISGLDEGVPNTITSSSSLSNLASFLGRVNYNYRSTYFLTMSFRADGSSKFPVGNKWGYFPSGALSWRFSREKFMNSLAFISDAKLRASAGVTGNNRVSDFAYLSTLQLPVSEIYPFNNQITKAAIPDDLGNPRLLWENTFQADVGLDLSFWKDRLTLTADWYEKSTYDLLLHADLPPSLGYRRTYKNVGKVHNRGLELSLYSMNYQTTEFSWSTSFNIAFNRNSVRQLTQNQETLLSNVSWHSQYNSLPLYLARIGQPIGMFYGLIWEGNYQFEDFDVTPSGAYSLKSTVPTNGNPRDDIRPGDIKYKDINRDGVVNFDDYTVIGNPNPKHFGGLSNNFTYKGFDLNVFFQWSYGNDVFNANRLVFEGHGGVMQNLFASYENRWTPENPNNEYYRSNGWGPYAYSSRVVEDASFVRLKTVALGYNLPPRLTRSIRLTNVRAYVSAQNLYTWSSYQGLDPEVSARHSALTPGFDYSVYPRARTITFGLNVSL
ncbi:TonB-dependent receptor [Parapedobacter defluvii]|uniref:TonB-dependent receptor n=1 Tax=Parapedobacter defluvii TaxID=2045106 RepID=UPI003341670E